jgi:hypothetical protein
VTRRGSMRWPCLEHRKSLEKRKFGLRYPGTQSWGQVLGSGRAFRDGMSLAQDVVRIVRVLSELTNSSM